MGDSSVVIRQAPLLDRDRDSSLFVAPDGYDRVSWAVGEGLNTLILGGRGQGKTSALRQLALWLRRNRPDRSATFLDLAAARSLDAALRLLVSAAAEALGQLLEFAPPLPRPNETEAERGVRVSLDRLATFAPCTFFLDNVHAGEVGFPMFGVMRDRLWETPHHWVLSGDLWDRRWLLRPPADAFWEEVVDLRYSTESARRLIERRLGGSPAWIGPLVDSVGPNPRRLLRATLAATRGDAQPEAVIGSWETWNDRVAQLDPRASALIAELSSRGPVSASDSDLLSSLGWARTSLLGSLDLLEREGFVESWSEPAGTGRPRRLFATTEPGSPRRG